jgi:probable rRNA maturation factor
VSVSFHSEHLTFNLKQKTRHKDWIKRCVSLHSKIPGDINFIFTSNEHILRINRDYLNHNYFTDVITFDYTEGDIISGDVFISLDQVKENASFYEVPAEDELRRVMIHGVLHLIGVKDSTNGERETMMEMENEALHLWLKEE